MLGLDATRYGPQHNTTILYFQGPIASKMYAGNAGLSSGATFVTEIHSGHPEQTKGQMAGSPALLWATYGAGQGRVLVSPPHPEETLPRLDDVVEAYVRWAGRG